MKPDIIIVSHKSEYVMKMGSSLRRSGINALYFEDTHDARAGLALHSPAFLLFDLSINGMECLLSEILYGDVDPIPYIIIASTYSDSKERAAMYRRGADACIEEPINLDEIFAIIEAVRRREARIARCLPNHRDQIRYKDLVIDVLHRSVTMRGEAVVLTRKEYGVLCALANHVGSVMTKEEIYTAVWRGKYNSGTTSVSDYISSLRHKLGLTSKDTTYIQTVIGVGYRFGTSI